MASLHDKIEGKVHETNGKITDHRSEELKGKAQQAADRAEVAVDRHPS